MADNWIQSFAVALGFDVDTASLNAAKKSVSDYERAVKDAEKRIEDARWAGAKTEEEIAKLIRETNLKEARAALAAAQDKEKAEKEQARKREERHKEFIAGMNKVALAAGAMATAISYAVNRVTQAFDNLGFVSARTGASVQSLNSLGYAFKQVGGSSQQAMSAVEKFAQAMRTNDGLKSYVASLGVDTTKDTADQLLDTVDALSKHPYQVGSREAGMLGISEEDYKLLTQYAAKVKEYRAEYDATTKALGVNSGQAAEASMAFQRTLTRLQATVSALGDKLMVSLAPALEAIVKRFQDWITANPEKVEHIMRGISDAVVWLADKIRAMVEWFASDGGKKFMERWDDFSARITAIAHGFETVWGVLQKIDGWLEKSKVWQFVKDWAALIGSGRFGLGGVIQDAITGGSGAHGVSFEEQRERDSGVTGAVKRAWRATKRVFSGGSAEAHGGNGALPAESDETVTTHGHRWKPGANTESGRARVASWLKFFQAPVDQGGMGADTETARAMVAMMQGESGASLRPDAKGDYKDPVNKIGPTAFGTAQWREDRFDALKAMAARMKTDWTDVGAQQQHLRNEMLHGRYRAAWDRIQRAPTGEAKLLTGIKEFERPKYPEKAYDFRVNYLQALRRAPAPAVAAGSSIVVPPAAAMRGLPAMSPGGFDVNNINPKDLMRAAPMGASPITNNSTSSSSRSLSQTNTFKVDIHGSQTPREHAEAFTKQADGLYALALRNAQTATV